MDYLIIYPAFENVQVYVDNKSVMHLSNKLKSCLNTVPEIQCRGNDCKRVTGKFSSGKISHLKKINE